MASGAVVGALRVVLGADTASFEKGLKKSKSRLGAFSSDIKLAAAAAATAMAAAATAIGVAINRAIDNADKMGKMAQSIGIPVEELSRLAHAADLSGVSIESLSAAVGSFNRNIVEAAQGLQTPQRAFAALGIEIKNTDGSLRTVGELLPQIADKFAAMRDGPEKTALAMQLLGRAGADMIPLLNAGSDGLREMMEEADALGLTISGKTAKAAQLFNDNLSRLSAVWTGVINQVMTQSISTFANLSEKLLGSAKDAQAMALAGDRLSAVLKTLASVAVVLGGVFHAAWQQVSGLGGAIANIARGEFTAAFDSFLKGSTDMVKSIGGSLDLLKTIWADAAAEAEATAPDLGRRLAAPMIENANQAKKAAAEVDASVKAAQAAQERLREQGAQVFESTRTPLEALSNEMARLNMLLQVGVIDFDTWQRAASTAAYNAEQAMKAASASLSTAYGGAINEAIGFLNMFGKENKAAAIAAIVLGKALAIAQVIQMTAAAAMAAVAPPPIGLGPVAGMALAGAIKAMGAVQIGLIAATGGLQIAGVGSSSVSAPSGSHRASRGTEAAVTEPAAMVDRSVYIELKGEVFTREMVRELVDEINDFVKDGGKLVVA